MSRMRMIQYYEVLGLEWGTLPESARDCDALIERTCARILKTEKPDSSAPDLLQSWWTDRRDLILEARSLLGSSATRGKVTQELKRIYAVSVREDPMEPFSVLGIDLLKEADIRRDQKFEGISKEQDARIFEKAKKAYCYATKYPSSIRGFCNGLGSPTSINRLRERVAKNGTLFSMAAIDRG